MTSCPPSLGHWTFVNGRYPCLCLCLGFSHTTRTTPRRRTTLHLSHMRFTLARTFIVPILSLLTVNPGIPARHGRRCSDDGKRLNIWPLAHPCKGSLARFLPSEGLKIPQVSPDHPNVNQMGLAPGLQTALPPGLNPPNTIRCGFAQLARGSPRQGLLKDSSLASMTMLPSKSASKMAGCHLPQTSATEDDWRCPHLYE